VAEFYVNKKIIPLTVGKERIEIYAGMIIELDRKNFTIRIRNRGNFNLIHTISNQGESIKLPVKRNKDGTKYSTIVDKIDYLVKIREIFPYE
jgi:hypothetical protein